MPGCVILQHLFHASLLVATPVRVALPLRAYCRQPLTSPPPSSRPFFSHRIFVVCLRRSPSPWRAEREHRLAAAHALSSVAATVAYARVARRRRARRPQSLTVLRGAPPCADVRAVPVTTHATAARSAIVRVRGSVFIEDNSCAFGTLAAAEVHGNAAVAPAASAHVVACPWCVAIPGLGCAPAAHAARATALARAPSPVSRSRKDSVTFVRTDTGRVCVRCVAAFLLLSVIDPRDELRRACHPVPKWTAVVATLRRLLGFDVGATAEPDINELKNWLIELNAAGAVALTVSSSTSDWVVDTPAHLCASALVFTPALSGSFTPTATCLRCHW